MSQLRELSLWDEEYVESLPAGEFDWIEYKGSEKFSNSNWPMEMSKYVSAWANYDGGYIVFGVQDPKSGGPIIIDGGVPENLKQNLLNWLDDVIPALVEMPIRKLATWLIRPKAQGSKIKPGHVVIVVHIPESEGAPHQAQDHKYYQRLGRRLEPLRHRAVLDIVGRRRHPKVRTAIIVHIGAIPEPIVFWELTNVGSVMAADWKAVIRFPTAIGNTPITVENEKRILDETEDGKSYLEFRVAKGMGAALFPGSDVSRTFKLQFVTYDPPIAASVQEITVTTYADNMPAFVERFPLADVIRRH